MRPRIITAVLALTLVACSNRMQQLESAGEKLKSCVNQCSLAATPINTDKLKPSATVVSGKEEAVQESIPGGGDRIQTLWNSRLNLW